MRMQVNAGQQYQVEYACSCCGLFGGSGDCCQPLSACAYLTPSCGAAKPVTQAYFVSPLLRRESLPHIHHEAGLVYPLASAPARLRPCGVRQVA